MLMPVGRCPNNLWCSATSETGFQSVLSHALHPPPSPNLLCHQVLQKRGNDLALLGDTGSQFVACGRGEHGGTLCWWDTLSPPGSGLVAELRGGRSEPTALTLVHAAAGPVLVFGDEAGECREPMWGHPGHFRIAT